MTTAYQPSGFVHEILPPSWGGDTMPRITFRGAFRGENLGDRNWRLLAPITCVRDGVDWFTIPAGFVTDLLSTPRFTWVLFDPEDPEFIHSAAGHDFLYDSKCLIDITRTEADMMLREAGRAAGADALRCWLIWLGVRAAGWLFWRRASGLPSGSK